MGWTAPSPILGSLDSGFSVGERLAQEILIRVPDIGDFEDVEVVEILVGPGDAVEVEDPLVSVESDKATMEIPSPVQGRVQEVRVVLGEAVSEGSLLLVLLGDEVPKTGAASEVPGGQDSVSPPPALAGPEPSERPGRSESVEPISQPTLPSGSDSDPAASSGPDPGQSTGGGVHAGPGVRRYARQLGVDLADTRGTGPLGRVLEVDVTNHVHGRLTADSHAGGGAVPPVPEVDFSRFGPVREEPLAKIRRVSARNLSRSWLNAPHVTQHDEADVTDLEAFRRTCSTEAARRGVKLSPLHFVLKAVAVVLAEFPDFRSSLAPGGEALIVKDYLHLGVAVDTENGLVVPVIRDVESKGIFELAEELADLAERARTRKLTPADMQGGCFSLSSLGGIGGTAFTPIVNVPEVAILGLSKLRVLPRWSGGSDPAAAGAFEGRSVLPLSLSYDHRVIDGAAAARFTTRLGTVLAHPGHLLL
jgi:pyruvate dehydrogenase E2 component (dihydrolipoamide acetyltransferase)